MHHVILSYNIAKFSKPQIIGIVKGKCKQLTCILTYSVDYLLITLVKSAQCIDTLPIIKFVVGVYLISQYWPPGGYDSN